MSPGRSYDNNVGRKPQGYAAKTPNFPWIRA